MKNKKAFSFLVIIIIILCASARLPLTHAQQSTSFGTDQIYSDLALDLQLAQQNPSPDRQTIKNTETDKAEIVSSTGNIETVKPQDVVAPKVKTEPTNEAMHPEQTTSEQVVTTSVEIEVPLSPTGDTQNQQQDNNSTPIPTGTKDNLVPGTTVPAPDDNAAPADNSTNPNLPAPTPADNNSPTTPPSDQQVNPPSNTGSPGNTNSGTTNDTNQQAIPTLSDNPEVSGNPQPTSKPQDTPVPTGYDQPTPIDQNTNTIPPENGTGSQDISPTPVDSSVQGISTGPVTTPWWKKVLDRIFNIFR